MYSLCVNRSFSDKPESSDMEAITMSAKSANVVMIGMSDEFCEESECRKLLLYIKDVLRKPVLLLLLGKTKNWQKGDLNIVFGSEVGYHILIDFSLTVKAATLIFISGRG